MGKTNDHVNVKDIIPKQQTSIEDALNYSKIGNVYGTQKSVFLLFCADNSIFEIDMFLFISLVLCQIKAN